jgi:hypothetical protein
MRGRGASGGLAGAWIQKSTNPKSQPTFGSTAARFRLIVDDSDNIQPTTCALSQRVTDGAVSPSTISLKQASTIAEIRSRVIRRGFETGR